MKKLHGLLLLLGFAFLSWLIFKIGIRELWQQLTLLGWGLVPIVIAEGVGELLHTISWRYCLSDPHRSIPLMRLFRIHMAGYSINYLTPTATLGGEMTKGVLLASNGKQAEAASAVLIGKLSFALAHLLFVIFGSIVILRQVKLPPALWAALLISTSLLACGIGAFLWIQKKGKLGALIDWLVVRKLGGKVIEKMASPMIQVGEALEIFYRERPWGLPISVFWHLIGYSVGFFTTWYFLHLFIDNSTFGLAAGIWFFSMWFDLVAFAIPSNLGVLEGSRVVALTTFGLSAVLGMTYGIVTRVAQLLWAAFGMVSYALLIATSSSNSRTNCPLLKNFNVPEQAISASAKRPRK